MKTSATILILSAAVSFMLQAQTAPYNLDAYKEFLQDHQDMTAAELIELYPSDYFRTSVTPFLPEEVAYLDDIEKQYDLFSAEKSLLLQNGFVVTERLRKRSFFQQFSDIYAADLPVFVSTDAILHAFHYSYRNIVEDIELYYLKDKLIELLEQMHGSMGKLHTKYDSNPNMSPMLKDVDIYLTVPLKLLGVSKQAYYRENYEVVDQYLSYINAQSLISISFFAEDCERDIDFSQFKPRGNYARKTKLREYFKAMMWLGRMEIYLSKPRAYIDPSRCSEDQMQEAVKRQIIDAALIAEICKEENILSLYTQIEEVISVFVGEQDNVSLPDLMDLITESGISSADDLLNDVTLEKFQTLLSSKTYSAQQIISQVLCADPLSPESVVSASAFMLFGQRFVIDSYITGNVVFDQIKYKDQRPCRLFPSTLDILFSFGNDASTHLLIPELNEYLYSTNLAGLRYLISGYPDDFWESSMYTMWFYAIRSLNPRPDKEGIPEFMQTGAWGLEKMNTQLSSWAELRHDNILYAKQTYTITDVCEYPQGYVEPVPEFYAAMKQLASKTQQKLNSISTDIYRMENIHNYFENLDKVCNTLEVIARKELSRQCITTEELNFLNNLVVGGNAGCRASSGPEWYVDLHYGLKKGEKGDNFFANDFIVADYHTTPTDCVGGKMGWISHAGTGYVDMIITVVKMPDNNLVAFIGPVMSYHEYVTTNFKRLTDEEWVDNFLDWSIRPGWVNNYLVNSDGNREQASYRLLANEEELKMSLLGIYPNTLSDESMETRDEDRLQIYPQPISATAMITITVPEGKIISNNTLTIYDLQGRSVNVLLNEHLPPGHYLTRWDKTDNKGNAVTPGIYIVKLLQDETSFVQKITVME